MTKTHTVYFVQYQGEQPDFSDGRADQQLYQSLDAALEGFSSKCGHRRLMAAQVYSITGQSIGERALELKRV